jgi:hypothetical protein
MIPGNFLAMRGNNITGLRVMPIIMCMIDPQLRISYICSQCPLDPGNIHDTVVGKNYASTFDNR